MNERIQTLLAKFKETESTHRGAECLAGLDEIEKFSELIVKECCDVLQNETIMHNGYGYSQGFLHKKIKQHFGVEE